MQKFATLLVEGTPKAPSLIIKKDTDKDAELNLSNALKVQKSNKEFEDIICKYFKIGGKPYTNTNTTGINSAFRDIASGNKNWNVKYSKSIASPHTVAHDDIKVTVGALISQVVLGKEGEYTKAIKGLTDFDAIDDWLKKEELEMTTNKYGLLFGHSRLLEDGKRQLDIAITNLLSGKEVYALLKALELPPKEEIRGKILKIWTFAKTKSFLLPTENMIINNAKGEFQTAILDKTFKDANVFFDKIDAMVKKWRKIGE